MLSEAGSFSWSERGEILMIAGWCDGLEELLSGNYFLFNDERVKDGYLSCLYVFRMCMKPSHYERTKEMESLQEIIRRVISEIERTRKSAW